MDLDASTWYHDNKQCILNVNQFVLFLYWPASDMSKSLLFLPFIETIRWNIYVWIHNMCVCVFIKWTIWLTWFSSRKASNLLGVNAIILMKVSIVYEGGSIYYFVVRTFYELNTIQGGLKPARSTEQKLQAYMDQQHLI